MCYQKKILLSILSVSVAGAAHAGLRSSIPDFNSALAGVSSTTPSLGLEVGCDDPTSTEESRNGDMYKFQLKGPSDRICNDINHNEYDYGEIELDDDDDAADCAKACVDDPEEETLEHLVGYDWNCKDSLCHCLYDNDDLTESEESSFDSFDDGKSGSGSVDGTESEDDWRCYKLEDVTSGANRGGNNGNEDCEPETAEKTRKRIKYEFERFGGSDRVCTDSDDDQYDYGQFTLRDGDDADDCATACVNEPDKDTLEDLRGFDWNCDKSRCRCLYENNELSGSDENDFDSFENDNKGSRTVKSTEKKDGWRCYKLKYATPTSTENVAVA